MSSKQATPSSQPTENSCGNDECDKCDPRPRWRITEHRIQHITYEREIKAATEAEALAIFERGTAWPTSYDDNYGEIVQQDPRAIVQITGEGDDDQSAIDKSKLRFYREECCFHDQSSRFAADEVPE